MKKIIVSGIAFFFLFPFFSSAQNANENVSQIKKWYKSIEDNINNSDLYKVDEFVDDDNSGEGSSELSAYFDKETNQFVKLVEYTVGEWHEQWMSYYFNNGVLFFIFVEGYYGGEYYTAEELQMDEEEYFQMGLEPKNLDAYEERFYFFENECIQYLTKSKTILPEGPRNLDDVKNEEGEIYEIDFNFYSQHGASMLKAAKNKISGSK